MQQTTISERWKKKAALINEFFGRAENRKHTEFRTSDKKNCRWCGKFSALEFKGCLNCGTVFTYD